MIDVATIGAGVGAALAAGAGVYYQQHNRRADKLDAQTLANVSSRGQEIASAFDAWQKISAANTSQIASLTDRLDRMSARAEKCEEERVELLGRIAALEPR